MMIKPVEEDVFSLQKTISDLREEVEQLSVLQDMSRQVISIYDFDQIVNMFLEMVNQTIVHNSCVLYLWDEKLSSYQPVRFHSISEKDLKNLKLEDEIIEWVLKERRCTNIFLNKSSPKCPNKGESDFVTIVPLQGIKRDLGFLLVFSDPVLSLYQANIKHLSFLASQTAVALENHDLYSKLNRSREYVYNILEGINNGIITIDTSDDITHINKNATAMLGLPSADIIGLTYKKALPPDLAKMIERAKKQTARSRCAFETQFEHEVVGDAPIPLAMSFSPFVDHKGQHIGTIIVLRDMSASQEIERLRELDTMKSEFVSNVSHELRSPLAGIKSYVEALLEQVDPADYQTQREFLTVVDRETDRLAALINDLLDISRIESGRFEIELRAVALSDIVRAVLRDLESRTAKHEVVVDIPADLPNLWADMDKMIQLFLNLTDNAIKFSPKGGQIAIKARMEGKMIRCDISDQGLGMAKKEIPHIFEKFYRVDNSDTYEIQGTGLGLPIVKYIVESHQGKISVKSRLGKGSVFTVLLPCEREEPEYGQKDTGRR
ncbi:MAG: ATP-binding protein [Thermodesulfobacteriota bacterium]|nr:ATP-binding protein [Thermodesulfobacteriota bacterium]